MQKINDYHLWQRPMLNTMGTEQVQKIYQGALRILERTGIDFYLEEAVELMAGAGAWVENKKRVRIPAHMVKDALAAAPDTIALYDRNGGPAMRLGGRNSYFGTGSDTPFTVDVYSGEHRKAVIADVANGARVVDALPNLDFAMSMGLASDVHDLSSDCHHFEAMVTNTVKPLTITAWDLDGLKKIHEMMVAVKGSQQALEQEPFAIVFLMATSPLIFPKESLQKLLFCAEKCIPVIWTPGCAALGTTAPIHPAGTMAMSAAEFLAGLVLAQVKQRHCPVLGGGGGCCVMDMQTGIVPYGAPEYTLGGSNMARFLNIPSFGTGGVSDSKLLDEQAVAEAYQLLYHAAMAGANLIHDVGYMDNGMASSLDLVTICNEFIAKTRRCLEGVVVSEETLSLDLIHAIGPGGEYLTQSQTLEHFKEQIWTPQLVNRQDYETWESDGRKTLKQNANVRVRHILENHVPEPLATDVCANLRRLIEDYDRKLGAR